MRLALLLLPLLALSASARENPALALQRLEAGMSDRIRTQVLDPILGPGEATAFVRLTLAVDSTRDGQKRMGEGETNKVLDEAPGPGARKSADKTDSHQLSRQTKSSGHERVVVSESYSDMRVVILHDSGVDAKKLDEVRTALVAIYKPDLKPAGVVFQSARFSRTR
jgi:hypothetical protein